MKRKSWMKACSTSLVAAMALSLAACGSSAPASSGSSAADSASTSAAASTSASAASTSAASATSASSATASDGKEIVIHYPTFQVGSNTAAPVVAQLVKEFNDKYKGQYRIEVEDVPGDQNYADKIKVQMSSGELPPVVYGGGYALLDLALQNDMVVDLTDYVDQDPDWKAMYDDSWMEIDARDGKIYASSVESEKIGYFYNKELFDKVGIKPAETWDEFFSNCDKLKAAGITPLSMDTADGAWCSQLLMGAMIATSSDDGLKFMNTKYPTDYTGKDMVDAVTRIQKCFQDYTTPDANGGAYENAANNFFSGQTAIICNGPWMIGDFSDTSKAPDGFADKVGVATYPGGFVYNTPIEGMFVTKQKDENLQKAAVEMVKFFTSADAQKEGLEIQGMVPASSTVEVSDDVKQKYPLLSDFLDQVAASKASSNTLTGNMVPGLQDFFSAELPNLASGTDTPEQFCKLMTDTAQQNAVSSSSAQ